MSTRIKKAVVSGGKELVGEIKISGAKNSVLKLICASLLLKNGKLTLHNVPNLSDVMTLLYLINRLHGSVTLDMSVASESKTIILDTSTVDDWFAPYEIVSKMRATFNTLGPLLSRFGKAKVSLPGGCAIGTRGLDIHFDSLKQMGVDIQIEDGYVLANAINGKVQGANINFRFASVGATENIMLAAVLAEGKTIINNVAKEPEIVDIANCINAMGGKIKGAGTSTIEIDGVEELHSAEWTTIGDRMEAGSYMMAALLTNGDLTLNGLDFDILNNLIEKLTAMGADITRISKTSLRIKKNNKLKPVNIVTDVHPAFPTDLQAPMVALLANIDGNSEVDETIYENRFMHVPELVRMNANITLNGNKAIIKGQEKCYKCATVMASDLRCGMALILAGMAAKGETHIKHFYHVERGYEFTDRKLKKCGVDIKILYE
ncbi:MAG: UDP-N-acetylglucosamine 1-carboxyvinyltransferase [Rickettsiales bacterium]|jgi:UDP-N-acetylglucosamine 1-carboxyvinyltransferase|nr:UDP-N-acetylglucosamine 1-carboxyvinyltransferase [Rickettsiales bacterium]